MSAWASASVPALAVRLQKARKKVCLWLADEVHRVECPTILLDYENLAPAHAIGMTATPFRSDKSEAISLFDKMLYRYGVAQAQQPCLEPRQSSALVPISIIRERSSVRWEPQRSRSAVMSGPM